MDYENVPNIIVVERIPLVLFQGGNDYGSTAQFTGNEF